MGVSLRGIRVEKTRGTRGLYTQDRERCKTSGKEIRKILHLYTASLHLYAEVLHVRREVLRVRTEVLHVRTESLHVYVGVLQIAPGRMEFDWINCGESLRRNGGGDRTRTCISFRTAVFKTAALPLCDPSAPGAGTITYAREVAQLCRERGYWFSLDEPSRIPESTLHKYGTGSCSDRVQASLQSKSNVQINSFIE